MPPQKGGVRPLAGAGRALERTARQLYGPDDAVPAAVVVDGPLAHVERHVRVGRGVSTPEVAVAALEHPLLHDEAGVCGGGRADFARLERAGAALDERVPHGPRHEPCAFGLHRLARRDAHDARTVERVGLLQAVRGPRERLRERDAALLREDDVPRRLPVTVQLALGGNRDEFARNGAHAIRHGIRRQYGPRPRGGQKEQFRHVHHVSSFPFTPCKKNVFYPPA